MRLLFVIAALLMLAACSSSELKPEPLVDVDNQVKIKRVWSKDIGKTDSDRYSLLVPAFSAGTLYAADVKGTVTALNMENGKELWRTKLKTETFGGVGVYGNTVTVGSYEGEVIALEADTGEERWRSLVNAEVLSAPQPNSRVVVVHTIDGKLHGLDVATGEQLWLYDNTAPVLSIRGLAQPLVTETMVIAGFDNGKVTALDPSNGIPLWDQRVAIPKGRNDLERVVDIDGTPLLVGDLIFAGSFQGRILAISRATGRQLWARDISTHRNLASNGVAIFATNEEDGVLAFNFANGDDVWQNEQMLRRVLTGPAVVSGYVAIGDEDGYLHVLDSDNGAYLGRKKIDGSGVTAPLSVVADKLLVIDDDGTLHVLTIDSIAD